MVHPSNHQQDDAQNISENDVCTKCSKVDQQNNL